MSNSELIRNYLDAVGALRPTTEDVLTALARIVATGAAVELVWRDVAGDEPPFSAAAMAAAFLAWNVANQRVRDTWNAIPDHVREGLAAPYRPR